MIYYGRNRTPYSLDVRLGGGGEGEVFAVNGRSNLVAKLYFDKKFEPTPDNPNPRQYMREKIETMLDQPVDAYIDGVLSIAWPQDSLYDQYGNFVGFTMPRVSSKHHIFSASRERERMMLFPKYTWKTAIIIAYNLALAVDEVHRSGAVVGDMNPNNIMLNERGHVTLIDTDSFNIRNHRTGMLFKCSVGVPECLPPELQGKNLNDSANQFTKETDCFALSVHIFNLLMNNCHPFGCTGMNNAQASASNNPVASNIAKGNCPYVSGGNGSPSSKAPSVYMLPYPIRALVDRAFSYDVYSAVRSETIAKRPSAEEWKKALYELLNTPMLTCANDPHHVFPKAYVTCPWCAIENASKPRTSSSTPYSSSSSPRPSQIPVTSPISSTPPATPSRPASKKKHTGFKVFCTIAVILMVLACVGLFAVETEWAILQGAIGIAAAIGIFIFTIAMYVCKDAYIPQLWITGLLSVANIVLVCIMPERFATMACPISIGLAISLFAITHYAYDDLEEGIGQFAAILMACNLTAATTVIGGFSSTLWWVCFFIVPTLIIALIITAINNANSWDNGAGLATFLTIVIVGIHALLAFTCPHFLHSFNQFPEILDKEYGSKRAECVCGERIELGPFIAEIVHASDCDYWTEMSIGEQMDYLKSHADYDDSFHWAECECGMIVSYGTHAYGDGSTCQTCGYKKNFSSSVSSGVEETEPDNTDAAQNSEYISDELKGYTFNPGECFSYNGHYYRFYHGDLTWDEAVEFCQNIGGHLATVTSDGEWNAIREQAKSYGGHFWLGATDRDSQDTWQWITGEEWTFTAWSLEQAYSVLGADYLYISSKRDYMWYNWTATLDANAERGFICEWDYEAYEYGTVFAPENVVEHGGSYYQYFPYSMKWQDTVAFCEELGGHLATVTSESEWEFVRNYAMQHEGHCWLGAYSDNGTENWQWTNGEPWSFEAWHADYPRKEAEARYLYISSTRDYLWYNWREYLDSNAKGGFICEWD